MITYLQNSASILTIQEHLRRCDASFIPPLSMRADLFDYAMKLAREAYRFEAWEDSGLVGLLAVYEREWFVTNVSVLPSHQRRGIAGELLKRCVNHARTQGAKQLALNVGRNNNAAIAFYHQYGFLGQPSAFVGLNSDTVEMVCRLAQWEPFPVLNDYRKTLNYGRAPALYHHEECKYNFAIDLDATHGFDAMIRDTPTARYAYPFDLDVMHPMMIRTFEPWFVEGDALELGSYEGAFTKRLMDHFEEIQCVEGSASAVEKARAALPRGIEIIEGDMMTTTARFFRTDYDNIFMTHVLEHIEDPVRVLKRVNDEWLADGGRFFLACPNANAASRQIAVKMGKLYCNAEVTADEARHGHRRTYALDTLELAARTAGLKVVARGGIFFKALANFQLDKAKAAGIIDDAYLEGCYALGQVYPDLCASIYLICEKGTK